MENEALHNHRHDILGEERKLGPVGTDPCLEAGLAWITDDDDVAGAHVVIGLAQISHLQHTTSPYNRTPV